jgi:hypothetical protein
MIVWKQFPRNELPGRSLTWDLSVWSNLPVKKPRAVLSAVTAIYTKKCVEWRKERK